MTAAGWTQSSRLGWLAAAGLALAGLGLAYGLLPEWTWPAPRISPAAPRITLISSDRPAAPDAWEARAVRSPSLIALSGGALGSGNAIRRKPEINPPLQAPPGRAAGIAAPAEPGDAQLAGQDAGFLRDKNISGAGAYPGLLEAPVFGKSQAGGVALEYLGGLAGKKVELDGWTWEQWTGPGVPWTLTLDLQADEQGRIVRALLDAPGIEAALKESLIQSLYQRGRLQPAGPGHGRVIASYPGAP